MLYLQLDAADLSEKAAHYQLVSDTSQPLHSGNHVFCSISSANDPSRAPLGRRTVTVSTHVPMEELLALPEPQRAKRIAEIQDRMRETIASRAPEWSDRIVSSLPASPRTFERFTRRPDGFVGGIPRRAGLRQYLQLTQRSIAPGLHLVGDSIFPGQSTLATALGGVKVAERIASRR